MLVGSSVHLISIWELEVAASARPQRMREAAFVRVETPMLVEEEPTEWWHIPKVDLDCSRSGIMVLWMAKVEKCRGRGRGVVLRPKV